MDRPIKVLIAKPGLDGHDRGAKVVANALRDAGMEVIYTGLHQTPEMIVEAAVQEDVDVVSVSILSGAHMTLIPRVRELLDEAGMNEVPLVGGGIIPERDADELQRMKGIAAIFGPGTDTRDIATFIKGLFDTSK
ncbi:MAG: cobalamin B12-binding domain-containing protein [Gemmatimonadales bacterium]|jgi:methylmalonyl-CoA mutase C-terminal domain/subunit